MGGLFTKGEEVAEKPFKNILSRYEGRRTWFTDEKFIKDLEADSVDTEVLDEELQALESSESSSWRSSLHKFLESNPVQIAMCILVLIDAGVVIAEILLDINAIRMQSEDTSRNLEFAIGFLKRNYAFELDGYTGEDIFDIVEVLDKHPNVTKSRHRRYLSHEFEDSSMLSPQDKQYEPETTARRSASSPIHDSALWGGRGRLKRFLKTRRSAPEQPNHSAQTETNSFPPAVTDENPAKVTTSHETGSADTGGRGHHESGSSHSSHVAHELLELAHIFHFISIGILGIFVVQVILKVTALGNEFFHQKMEMFDAFIVVASFVLDVVFVKGVTNAQGDETAALIIIFLLWRILRIINGMMLTSKNRQEFRIKLQKRARRKMEKKVDCLLEDKEWRERELNNLKNLCLNKGATEEEVCLCKPRRRSVFQKLTTSTGLSSIASLSLGLSLSGPLVMRNQIPAYPVLPRSCRTSLAGTTGTKSSRSSSTSLEPMWIGRGGAEQSYFDNIGDSEMRGAYHRAPYLRSRRNTCEEVLGSEEGDVENGPDDSIDDDRNDNYATSMNDRGSLTTTDTGLASDVTVQERGDAGHDAASPTLKNEASELASDSEQRRAL